MITQMDGSAVEALLSTRRFLDKRHSGVFLGHVVGLKNGLSRSGAFQFIARTGLHPNRV